VVGKPPGRFFIETRILEPLPTTAGGGILEIGQASGMAKENLATAILNFGSAAKAKLKDKAIVGGPEDQLHNPFENAQSPGEPYITGLIRRARRPALTASA
jgi:hypothetical protein